MQNSIHERLKILIRSLGLNYKEFSCKTGIPYTTLQDYLAAKRIPGGENLQKIATQLHVNIHWLLTGEGEMMRQTEGAPPVNIKDIPIYNMKQWLDEFWQTATEDEKAWLKVEFGRVFPEFKEWLLKKKCADVNDPPISKIGAA